MAINFVTGLPRQGKTLFTICFVKERAEKENRPVYYCNIPEVTIEGWHEIAHPNVWLEEIPNDALVIVDELQDFWGMAPPSAKVPPPILELSKHGKRGIDFYFITQDPSLVHNTPRKLCETHYHVLRAFGTETAVIHKFQGMQTDPARMRKKSEKIVFKYPKQVFGKQDKAGNWIVKPWYKSADVHNVQRKIPGKIWIIPLSLIFAGLMLYLSFMLAAKLFKSAKHEESSQANTDIAKATTANVLSKGPSSLKDEPMTTEEYLASFMPRLIGFPHTAPRYDAITQPVVAPYPAACIYMKTKGCHCFTQQGTPISINNEMCMDIALEGYFIDWNTRGRESRESSTRTP